LEKSTDTGNLEVSKKEGIMPEKSSEKSMLRVSEFARQTGYSFESCRAFCRKGAIEGVERIECEVVGSGYYWMIPASAVGSWRKEVRKKNRGKHEN